MKYVIFAVDEVKSSKKYQDDPYAPTSRNKAIRTKDNSAKI